ncbi:hypothetical protein [Nocardia sp. NPDC004260]
MKNPDRYYGMCPTQLEGRAADGRPFYFRARHNSWVLRVGAPTDPDDYLGWHSHAEVIAEGDDPTGGCMDPEEVDRLVTAHLGEGWSSPYDDPEVISA